MSNKIKKCVKEWEGIVFEMGETDGSLEKRREKRCVERKVKLGDHKQSSN